MPLLFNDVCIWVKIKVPSWHCVPIVSMINPMGKKALKAEMGDVATRGNFLNLAFLRISELRVFCNIPP